MSKTARLLSATVAVTLALVGSAAKLAHADNPAGPDEPAKARVAFEQYKAALIAKDGTAASALVDAATLKYYGRIKQLALTAPAAKVKALPLVDKLMVVVVRARVAPLELRAMSGAKLFSYAVNQGWVGRQLGKLELGQITIEGNHASAPILHSGEPTSHNWQLRREQANWKVHLLSLFPMTETMLRKLIGRSGKTEDEFVLLAAGMLSGQPVTEAIWAPPAR